MGTKVIALGHRVRDKISGFTGVVTSFSKHLNGCDRVWISPPIDKDGKMIDGSWFDIVQLEVLEENVIPVQEGTVKSPPGGPPSRVK